jgi:hypothetical protein
MVALIVLIYVSFAMSELQLKKNCGGLYTMADKNCVDHISSVAQSNLNAFEALFGVDGNGFKNARLHPEALAALKDLQSDAKFWAKNGRKIRQQIEILVTGTAEKTVTLGMVASAVNKFGKPIINAKYNAALDQKKFGNFLEEKKLQAEAQFGQEQARHSTQMQFQQAENSLQAAIFRANVQMRVNQLKLKANAAQQQFQSQHQDFRAQAAMQMGSNAPFLSAPSNISIPNVNPSTHVPTGNIPGLGFGTDSIANTATGRGLFGMFGNVFGFFGNAVGKVRGWLGI